MSLRKLIPILILVVVSFWAPPAQGSGGDLILGPWKTPDGDAQFQIFRCGQEYCGKISMLDEPLYPPTAKKLAGQPKIDRKNPNPALRNRPLLGLTILSGIRYEGGNSWRGHVYNPEDGNTYMCKLSIAGSENRLNVRGYLGVPLFGQTQTWTREKAPGGLEIAASGAGGNAVR